MQSQLAQDLVGAVRSALVGDGDTAQAELLPALEDEYRLFADRKRRLDESIELLERPGTLKAEAAARLQLYRANDERVSRHLNELSREIDVLRRRALQEAR